MQNSQMFSTTSSSKNGDVKRPKEENMDSETRIFGLII